VTCAKEGGKKLTLTCSIFRRVKRRMLERANLDNLKTAKKVFISCLTAKAVSPAVVKENSPDEGFRNQHSRRERVTKYARNLTRRAMKCEELQKLKTAKWDALI